MQQAVVSTCDRNRRAFGQQPSHKLGQKLHEKGSENAEHTGMLFSAISKGDKDGKTLSRQEALGTEPPCSCHDLRKLYHGYHAHRQYFHTRTARPFGQLDRTGSKAWCRNLYGAKEEGRMEERDERRPCVQVPHGLADSGRVTHHSKQQSLFCL